MKALDITDIQIRPARDSDREAIARIHALSWQDAYRTVLPDAFLDIRVFANRLDKWLAQEILPQDLVLVAEAENEIRGFIAIWCRPDPFIDNLHVLPGLRAMGLGTRLMQTAALELRRRGHALAALWVVETNTRAIRFYERLGGVCTGHQIHHIEGTPVPAVKMEWQDLGPMVFAPSGGGCHPMG